MNKIKTALIAVAVAAAMSISAAVTAFLNEVYLEISFDKLKDFSLTDLATYKNLGTALKIDLETAEPRDYVAYLVDDDAGKRIVRKADVTYRNYQFHHRISGTLTFDDDQSQFNISGYYSSSRLVFSHRGPISGTGVYMLDPVQLDKVNSPVYVGYAIMEEVPVPGSAETSIARCPIIMIEKAAASKMIPSVQEAQTSFALLHVPCAPFTMPGSVSGPKEVQN